MPRNTKGETVNAIRTGAWGVDPPDINRVLIQLGMFLAQARYRPKLGDADEGPQEVDRGITLLVTVARGRAMCQGRRVLEHDDLYLPTHIMFSSVPDGRMLRALAKNPQGLSPAGIARECGWSAPTAKERVERLVKAAHLVETCTPPIGQIGRPPDPGTYIRLVHEWNWLKGFRWL